MVAADRFLVDRYRIRELVESVTGQPVADDGADWRPPPPAVQACTVIRSGLQYDSFEDLARELGVREEWRSGNSCRDGDTGDVVGECVCSHNDRLCVAVRLHKNGNVVLIEKAGIELGAADAPPAPRRATDPAGTVFQWDNDGSWESFDPGTQRQLRDAQARGRATGTAEAVAIRIGRYQYRVNLGNMTQTNLESGNVRQIRAVGRGDAGQAPRRAAPRRPVRAEPSAEQVAQLSGFTGASVEACTDALRQAGGSMDMAAARLLEASASGPGSGGAERGGARRDPRRQHMIGALFDHFAPAPQEGGAPARMDMAATRRFLLAATADSDDEAPPDIERFGEEQWREFCEEFSGALPIDPDVGMGREQFVHLFEDDDDDDDERLVQLYTQLCGGAPDDAPAAAAAAEVTATFREPGLIGISRSFVTVRGEDVLHIDEVHDGTPAANVPGLRSGLCLRSVNGTPASTFSQTDLLEALSARPVTLIFYDPESEEGEPPPAFAEGDRATVIDDVALCRRLADGHGGWADGMEAYCGETGTVMVVDEDGDVSLQFADGEDWTWNPAALRRAPDVAAPPPLARGGGTLHPRGLAQARVDDAPPGEDAGPASATHLFARTRFVRTKLLS